MAQQVEKYPLASEVVDMASGGEKDVSRGPADVCGNVKISIPAGAKFPVLWHYALVAGDNDGPGAAAPQVGVAVAHSPATPRQAATSGDQQPALLPSIFLPKGGGAVRGIGEKFSTNPGAEALVLVRVKDGAGTRPDAFDCGDYRAQRRRPRTDRLFAHIERWTSRTTRDAHWRAITRDNVLNIYGRSPTARIADPNAPPESSPGCSRRSTTTAATSLVKRTRPKTIRASIRARRVAASPGST